MLTCIATEYHPCLILIPHFILHTLLILFTHGRKAGVLAVAEVPLEKSNADFPSHDIWSCERKCIKLTTMHSLSLIRTWTCYGLLLLRIVRITRQQTHNYFLSLHLTDWSCSLQLCSMPALNTLWDDFSPVNKANKLKETPKYVISNKTLHSVNPQQHACTCTPGSPLRTLIYADSESCLR